uniref:Uncharacterized protein n=1 Tax=Streptomyces sp. NBC_00049 TaxID=2903617 RepID=A0AAU2JYK9_9ACTN
MTVSTYVSTPDHRFALLTARAGLEPELAQRYTTDPLSVLAEFGLPAAEPLYGDMFARAEIGLVIDDLDRSGATSLFCTSSYGQAALA